MLPFFETLQKYNTETNKKELKDYIISQNRLLSGIVSKNTQTLQNLEKILAFYDIQNSSPTERNFHSNKSLNEILNPTKDYNIRLTPWRNIPNAVCKSKYFKISAELCTDEGIELSKEERIIVSVSLYSYDIVPKRITHTMQGRNIFRGNTKSVLAYDIVEEKHLVHFKLQIKEVSSHFVGGLFYLVLEPDQNLENKGILIKPLLIENLKVKAKESNNS